MAVSRTCSTRGRPTLRPVSPSETGRRDRVPRHGRLGRPIAIERLGFRRQSGRAFYAEARTLSIGEELVSGDIDSQQIIIDLWETELALPETGPTAEWWTGEIKVEPILGPTEGPLVHVTIGGHSFRFSRQYRFESAVVGGAGLVFESRASRSRAQ